MHARSSDTSNLNETKIYKDSYGVDNTYLRNNSESSNILGGKNQD